MISDISWTNRIYYVYILRKSTIFCHFEKVKKETLIHFNTYVCIHMLSLNLGHNIAQLSIIDRILQGICIAANVVGRKGLAKFELI